MLSNDKSVVRYTISAAVKTYDIDFPFWDFSEIVVTAFNSTTGESIMLKKDIDYTITVSEPITDPVYQNGTVNMVSTVYEDYTSLVIARELPALQETDLKNGEPMNADTVERVFDRLTALIQQLRESVERSFKLPISEDPEDLTFPGAADRAGKVIGFDQEDGNQVVLYEVFSDLDSAVERAETAAGISESAASVAADAKVHLEDMLAMRRAYYTTIGDGVTKTFIIRHNLGTNYYIPCVWCSSTDLPSYYTLKKVDINTCEITFEEAPPEGSVSVVLSGVDKAYLAKMKWEDIEDVQVTGDQVDPNSIMYESDVYDAFGVNSNINSRLLVRRRR